MALDFRSGTGLMDRLGKLAYLHKIINTFRGTSNAADTMGKELNDALVKYDGASNAIRGAVDHLVEAYYAQADGFGAIVEAIRQAAENTAIEMADANNPLVAKTVEEAIREIIREQYAAGPDETIDANEPSIAAGSVSNLYGSAGTGAVVASVKNGKGQSLENALAEDIVCRVTNNATAGAEVWTCDGERDLANGDRLSHLWPSGSGASVNVTSANGDSGNNKLTNGTFDAFTGNTPDSWTIATGTAGVEVFAESTTVFRSSTKALKLAGGTGVNTQLTQTLTTLAARTLYAVTLWIKADVVPASGVITVDLHDGSSTISDESSTSNSLTITLSGISTSYACKQAVFILPDPLPSTVKLRIRASTAIPGGTNIYIDDVLIQPMTQLYNGGPSLAFVGGATNWTRDDLCTVTVTNDYRGEFVQYFNRWFNMADLNADADTFGLQLVSATGGGETISDALIA